MKALRRIPWLYAAIAVVATALAVFGLIRPQAPAATDAKSTKKPGATDRVRQNPPPPLFPDAAVSDWTKRLEGQQRVADALFAQWRKQHGATRDDRAFTAWAAAHVPAPPSKQKRTKELKQVQKLARTRTAAGKKAATWLEVYGKKDIWKLYLHDQRELIPRSAGDAEKAQLKAALKMAKKISDQLATRYKQPAPFVLDPKLRPEKKIKPGATCPCSYPSRHAARSAAAVTMLSVLSPRRAADYQWMQDEVVQSRVYMAGHVPSDILAGALLGDLIGDYMLTTNGHTLPNSGHTVQPAAASSG